MSKRFCFIMFCVFVCLALICFFIGGLQVAVCFNLFMACLYLAKLINEKKSTGNHNTGDCNTGNKNIGHRNTGDSNEGNHNVGSCNIGNYNIGNCNTGDFNLGNSNAGYCNTGSYNTGNHNSGYCNTGNHNTGSWNTGNWNIGFCNTITSDDVLIFNKPAKRSDWENAEKPVWMFVSLTKWIFEEDMTDKEKEEYPNYKTTGGYLKVYPTLQAAYIDAWNKASKEDKELTFKLPNFDLEVFKEIFGFTPIM